MKVLILGATGLVGQRTLVQAVTNPAITQVIAPTRTPLPPSSQLANPVAQRLELLLPEVLSWGVDAVIRALGTTSSKAGSKEAFRQVDYVLPLALRSSLINKEQKRSPLSRRSVPTPLPHSSIRRPRARSRGT